MKILDLIKEEVSKFDYLNNDKRIEETENLELLNNDEFQKKFIIDSIEKNSKVKKYSTNDDLNSMLRKYGDIQDNLIDAEISIGYEYLYDSTKDPITFNIDFNANKVPISDGELNNEEDINKINWNQFNVVFTSINGDIINFKMFNQASDKIKGLFIKTNIKDILIKGLL